ncbi:MAG: DUF4367 domain-containing protein [Ruminococcus sp.]|nr:DUF4367 domain-containing protein [Ruminococcus sp.]
MDRIIDDKMLISALEIYENKRLSDYNLRESFTPSKSFEKKMEKLIKSQTNFYYRVTYTKTRKTLVALVATLILLASVLSVTAVRETILNFFVYHGDGENNAVVIEYNDENSSLYPKKIEKAYSLSYVPEGYTLSEKTSDEDNLSEIYVCGEDYLDFEQFTKDDYLSASDSEFSAAKSESFNGQDYIIRTSDDMTMLIWEKDGYVFELVGFIEKSEMFKVADSAKGEVLK